MTERTVPVLKFVGTVSLGLLTGFSYALSVVTLPTILVLPTASIASETFINLRTLSVNQIRTLAGISSSSFFLAYLLSPRAHKHPYLLWTTLTVGTSFVTDLIPRTLASLNSSAATESKRSRDNQAQAPASRPMDASYEVLGAGNHDDEQNEEEKEESNTDDVRLEMESFMLSQFIRTAVTGLGFMMSIVGIWGDGFGSMLSKV